MDVLSIKLTLLAALVFIPLERLLPYRREQPLLRPQWQTDAVYMLLNVAPAKVGLGLTIVGIVWCASWLVPAPVKEWVGALPFVLQFLSVLVLSDLGLYAMHRAFHTPMLWRFHAVHHSSEHMDWMVAHRVHAVDLVLTRAVSLIPVFALGFSAEAVLLYTLVFFWHAHLQHSNLRVNLGPLRWLVATPQFHHWHHANQPEAFDKNFAGQLAIIDLVFGTYRLPGREMPQRYGTDDPVPDGYLRQLAYPFRAEHQPAQATASAPAADQVQHAQ